jgi:hypothetical protein
LMDVVHNLPHLIQQWERCNEALLLEMLRDHDARWGAGLLDTYERRIDGA